MKTPIHRLPKAMIVKMATAGKCKHGHTYLAHPNCYEGNEERVGFFDIETSNLEANFGLLLTYCIKDGDSDKIYEGAITASDIAINTAGDEDRNVVEKCVKDIMRFDRLITYYGNRFDMPFIRTRAVSLGIEFPEYGSVKHNDIYFLIRNRFKLNSNRLKNACKVLLGKTDKTEIEYRFWRGALRGDKESIGYILEHNRYDVLDLEKLYHKVIKFGRPTNTSM